MTEIKTSNRGGKRIGAGRPKTGRKRVCFQLTDGEKEIMTNLLSDIRSGFIPVTRERLEEAYKKAMHLYVSQNGSNRYKGRMEQCGLLLGMTFHQIRRESNIQKSIYVTEQEEKKKAKEKLMELR